MIEPKFRYLSLSKEKRSEILEKLRRSLEDLGSIVFAYVHGGFIEREFFRDLDLALWVEDLSNSLKYAVDLSVKLRIKLGIPVDVQVLNEAPLPFKYHVFTEGTLVISRDEDLRSRVVDVTIREYLDFKKLKEVSRKTSSLAR
ncbi:MAG: nucleotidyltransferase domain-containing protein [Thermoproteota archaeon]|nr:MAG: nucleotidyltransferase domain-containing protein [Candidatus Korarchaeota archaeon]